MSDEVKFDEAQQALVDKLIGEARMKARTKAETDGQAAQAKASEEAEKVNLAAKNEWQKLAAKSEARVKELEPFVAQAEAYITLLEGMLKDKVKELGDAAKKAVDSLPESMSVSDKLGWLNKNAETYQEAGSQSVLGTPPGKKKQPGGTKKDAEAMGHKHLGL